MGQFGGAHLPVRDLLPAQSTGAQECRHKPEDSGLLPPTARSRDFVPAGWESVGPMGPLLFLWAPPTPNPTAELPVQPPSPGLWSPTPSLDADMHGAMIPELVLLQGSEKQLSTPQKVCCGGRREEGDEALLSPDPTPVSPSPHLQ